MTLGTIFGGNSASVWHSTWALIPYNLEAAIERVAWDYLYDLRCGWENNDGAFDTLVFDVPARMLTLEPLEISGMPSAIPRRLCRASRSLTRINSPGPVARAAALLSRFIRAEDFVINLNVPPCINSISRQQLASSHLS
jgi:hypothetical protein